MNSALDKFERSLVTASRALYALEQNASTRTEPAASAAGSRPASARRRQRAFERRRLMVALVALVVLVSGVAAASQLLWPSQRLANGKVSCFLTTDGTTVQSAKTPGVRGTPDGRPPLSVCRMWYRVERYRLNGSRTGPKVADLPLVACRENPTTVAVYVATGRSDQCQQLGERPIPATYAGAAARLRNLQAELLVLQNQRDCTPVTALASDTRAILAGQGFTGWRVITPPPDPWKGWLFGYALPAGTGGTCGKLLVGSPPSKVLDINTQRQTVTVSVGPPRSISLELNSISSKLYRISYDRCLTATSVRVLVREAFVGTPLRPRFATVNTSLGSTYAPRSQRLYDQGCVRFDSAIPGNDNRFVDVLLNARNAVRLPAGQFYPAASSFHP
jgi:hypothetical protein